MSGTAASVILHHLVLAGSDAAVGRALAEVAIDLHGLDMHALLVDARYARARRAYFERQHRAHSRRMRGVATALGLHLDDDRFDFSILPFGTGGSTKSALAGHASYTPGWLRSDGHGLLTRSAWVTGTPIEMYVVEWYPRSGQPSVAVHAFDLLSGTIVGVNAAGLVVAAVAIDSASPPEAQFPPHAVGCHELQLMRLVLDACASVEEAQAALLASCESRFLGPARYLVADLTGRSFVHEREARSVPRLIDGEGDGQEIDSSPDGISANPAAPAWIAAVDQEARKLAITVSAGRAEGAALGNDASTPFVFTPIRVPSRCINQARAERTAGIARR